MDDPLPPVPASEPHRPFIIQPMWMSGVFSSPARTAELLQPEVDNAILARADYERLTKFYPTRYERLYYPMICGPALGFFLRSRGKSRQSAITAGIGGTLCLALTAMVYQSWTLIQFANSIEDKPGFMRAMENIQQKVGYTDEDKIGELDFGYVELVRNQSSKHISSPLKIPTSELMYHPRWMENAFSSRQKVTELLGPELDNSTLTRADYDKLHAFFPFSSLSDYHYLLSAPATVFYLHSPDKWRLRLMVGGAGAFLLCRYLNNRYRLSKHTALVNSLDDLDGVARAMEHVEQKVGQRPEDRTLSIKATVKAKAYPKAPFVPAERVAEPTSAPNEVRDTNTSDTAKAWDNIRHGRRADGSPLDPGQRK
ncbi:hypothetical protein HMN09_00655600 [Mycena chlorophos]|uniref:Uncharacterized protein n=1 Tax=Mycena chlorophos TaxID=658473 RepID=A0A8H6W9X3_MYCCL|nr:hypothetical protein HMN09_00655600 [Mycena chlorophos]